MAQARGTSATVVFGHQSVSSISLSVVRVYSSQPLAKEAFVMALDDARLQLKLMEREPKTVEDALSMATKLEA